MAGAGGGGLWGSGDNLTLQDPGGTSPPDLPWGVGYNGTLTPPTAPLGNTSAPPRDPSEEDCTEWSGATLTLFQVANFICLLAFLVPHNFRLSGLVMRAILSVGVLLFTLWACLDLCAVDILAWNLSFLLINGAHVLYLTYSVWPPRVPDDLLDVYEKVFRPLKVNRQNFRHLAREGRVLWLEAGETYATEDLSPADQRLSILLVGKLKVTCDSTHLHYILPNQFIDSPEWEACPDDSEELFQVTIVAEEKSKYLCWPRSRLHHVLQLRPFLRAIIYNLVGKDITTKLYSLNEQLSGGGEGEGGRGAQDMWRGAVQRSMSLDTVHTGTKGFVRSLAWRAARRRTSASYCDSVRSSPGRSGNGSNSSDPTMPGAFIHTPQREVLGGVAAMARSAVGVVGSETTRLPPQHPQQHPLQQYQEQYQEQYQQQYQQLYQQQQQQQGGFPTGGRKGTRDNVVRCVPSPLSLTPAPAPALAHAPASAPAPAPAPTPAPASAPAPVSAPVHTPVFTGVRAEVGQSCLALDDPLLLETSV